MVEIDKKYKKVFASGKRKTAVAKAVVTSGNGKVLYNKKDYKNLNMFDRLHLEEPIKIAEAILGKLLFDVEITVRGGGEKSQVEAGRLAMAKGIIEFTQNKELEKAYFNYDRNLLVADVRRKEAYKPGDSKARKKRQTSFR